MALLTLGTNGTTTLNALVYLAGANATDLAQIVENIKAQNAVSRIAPGAFDQTGRLHFPGRRGWVNLLPGDYIAYDLVGWPIVVSSYSIANSGGWTHS